MTRVRKQGRFRTVAAAVGVALVVVACSSGQQAASSGQGKAVTLYVEASPTGPIPDNFNPFLTTGPAVLLGAVGAVYEPLIQYDLEKPGVTYPWLATSYSFSNGDRTLTFRLRSGVHWSDGAPFTSADVVFTFDLLKRYPAINTTGITFDSITAQGPHQVVMTFSSPAYVQLYDIAGATPIVPQHIWASVGNPAAYADSHPVGTGPYLVTSITPQGIDMKRNPHYWQAGLPKVAALEFPVFDSNTSANLALEQGRLDWAGNFVPHIQQVWASKDPSTNHYAFPPLRTAYLCFNDATYPFNLPSVRQALSMALDRKAISDAGEFGEQPPALSPTGLVLPIQDSLLAPQYRSLRYRTNDAAAVRLLQSAGFTRTADGSLLEPNGKPFQVTIIGPTPYTDVMADFQEIAQQLKAIGVEATVQGESVTSWVSQTDSGQFQASACAGNAPEVVDPYTSFVSVLDSSLSAPVGKTAIGDQERFMSPEADRLLSEWANATNPAQRQQALDGIEQIMVQQVPLVPIFYNVGFAEWSTSKVVGWPSTSDPYQLPGPTGIEDEVVLLHLRPVQ